MRNIVINYCLKDYSNLLQTSVSRFSVRTEEFLVSFAEEATEMGAGSENVNYEILEHVLGRFFWSLETCRRIEGHSLNRRSLHGLSTESWRDRKSAALDVTSNVCLFAIDQWSKEDARFGNRVTQKSWRSTLGIENFICIARNQCSIDRS